MYNVVEMINSKNEYQKTGEMNGANTKPLKMTPIVRSTLKGACDPNFGLDGFTKVTDLAIQLLGRIYS